MLIWAWLGRRGLGGGKCVMAGSEADPAVDSSASPGGGGYVKLGKGEELRHVERDVIIPKIMKENAMRLCSEYVQGWEHPLVPKYSLYSNHAVILYYTQ